MICSVLELAVFSRTLIFVQRVNTLLKRKVFQWTAAPFLDSRRGSRAAVMNGWVARGIGASRWRHHWRASCFSESPFLTNGRWLAAAREATRPCPLLPPALLASELWPVLGWLVPADRRHCLPENGRRRRFSAAPRAPWFHLRPTPRARRSRGS